MCDSELEQPFATCDVVGQLRIWGLDGDLSMLISRFGLSSYDFIRDTHLQEMLTGVIGGDEY